MPMRSDWRMEMLPNFIDDSTTVTPFQQMELRAKIAEERAILAEEALKTNRRIEMNEDEKQYFWEAYFWEASDQNEYLEDKLKEERVARKAAEAKLEAIKDALDLALDKDLGSAQFFIQDVKMILEMPEGEGE